MTRGGEPVEGMEEREKARGKENEKENETK